jgi:putative cell wall-binding protein
MTRLSSAAIAVAIVALSLFSATPAAASQLDYSVSPAFGPAGTTITVSSSQPCPTPPPGSNFVGIGIEVADAATDTTIAATVVDPNPDGTWTTSVQIPSSTPNGEYVVVVSCFADESASIEPYDSYEPVKKFVVTPPPGQEPDPVVRLAGTDRILTAIAASQHAFKTDDSVATVVLSRSDSYADALAGTPMATTALGPLLLTPTAALDSRTKQEIDRVLKPGGEVVVLGGTAAISGNVAITLRNSGYTVTRLAGVNRYATAVRIANQIASKTANLTTVLLANGNDFHDGLIAGAAAYMAASPNGSAAGAVLLTNGETMAPETQTWLDAHTSVSRFAVGAMAVKAAPTATGIAGTDFADTSRKVAAQFFPSPASVAFASSANFPDALSGGAHAAAFDSPLLFTDPTNLPNSVRDYLVGLKSQIVIGFVYGGTAAISEDVRTAIVQAIS